MRISTAIFLLYALTLAASANDDRGSTPLPKVTARAIELSKVTAPGSAPFHLKAVVSEPGNRNSNYNAEIEEYWAAPDKWRRTIKAAAFSQMLVVNGESTYEQDTGDYYPFWLKNMVTALLEFMPDDFTPRGNLTVANPSAQTYAGLSRGGREQWSRKAVAYDGVTRSEHLQQRTRFLQPCALSARID